jgi:hypothetical protein
LHIWKEHVEINHITNFHEKINWQSLLYRIPLTDQGEMCNLYRGPSIDASYQVSVLLAMGFRRRRLKCEKLTDDGCQVMAKAHIDFGKVS